MAQNPGTGNPIGDLFVSVVPWVLDRLLPRSKREVIHRNVYDGIDPSKLRNLEDSIRKKDEELGKLKENMDQQKTELMLKFSEQKDRYDEEIRGLNASYETNMKRIETEKSREIEAVKTEMRKREAENAQNLSKMQLSELNTRVETLLLSVQRLKPSYQQLFKECQKQATQCLESHKQAITEKSHLEKRFKHEDEDKGMIRLVLYGPSGHGKSTLGNRLYGDESSTGDSGPFTTGGDVISVTQGIKKKCVKKNGKMYKYGLSITDQPGTDDSEGQDRMHANNLVQYLRGIGHINAIAIVKTHQPPRLDRNYQAMLNALADMLGEEMWKHVVIILTHTKPSIQGMEAFKTYCQTFRERVREQLKLDEENAPLPIIGVELADIENCKKKLAYLVDNVLSRLPKFKCQDLKSPLDELLTEKKHKIAEFEAKFKELLDTEEFLINLNKKICETEREILKKDPQYPSMHKSESYNLSQQVKRGWEDKHDNAKESSSDEKSTEVSEEESTDDEDLEKQIYRNYEKKDRNMEGEEEEEEETDKRTGSNNNGWTCDSCTFLNSSNTKRCAVCDSLCASEKTSKKPSNTNQTGKKKATEKDSGFYGSDADE